MPTRITIDGQAYESPDEMPPDVRRQYEEALRMIGPALAGGKRSDTTQVTTDQAGLGLDSNIVIRRTIVVNNRTYKSAEGMPPEVRQFVESGLRATGTTGAAPVAGGPHAAVEVGRPRVRAFVDYSPTPPAPPLPIDPTDRDSKARDIVWGLISWVVIGLVLWTLLALGC
jgi:hypothetical protein